MRRPGERPAVVAGLSRAPRVRTLLRRWATIGGLGGRTSARATVYGVRRMAAPGARRQELDAAFELRDAEAMTEALGNMKGAMMKLGQMASYLDQGLPAHVREALAELRTAPPMSAGLAAEVVDPLLGGPPDDVFATWDPTPIAAASIGQVHRAMTHDGRAVAVKVQYPGVGDAIRADLDNAGLLFAARWGCSSPGSNPSRCGRAARAPGGGARLPARGRQPAPVRRPTTGATPSSTCPSGRRAVHRAGAHHRAGRRRALRGARDWDQAERDLAAETIFRFVFGSLYRLHAFNGDPHPGNYLFRPGGRVTFLDFGLVKRLRRRRP